MTAKAAISLFNDAALTVTVQAIDFDAGAFSSGVLYLESDAASAGTVSADLREIDPITGRVTLGQPLGNSQSVTPGQLERFRITDLAALRYRLSAYVQSGSTATFTATFVGES